MEHIFFTEIRLVWNWNLRRKKTRSRVKEIGDIMSVLEDNGSFAKFCWLWFIGKLWSLIYSLNNVTVSINIQSDSCFIQKENQIRSHLCMPEIEFH